MVRRNVAESQQVAPPSVISAGGEDQQNKMRPFLSFSTPQFGDFADTSKKAWYIISITVLPISSADKGKDSRWCLCLHEVLL